MAFVQANVYFDPGLPKRVPSIPNDRPWSRPSEALNDRSQPRIELVETGLGGTSDALRDGSVDGVQIL